VIAGSVSRDNRPRRTCAHAPVFFTSEKQVTCRTGIVPFFAVHHRRGGLNRMDPAQKIDRGANNCAASGCRTEFGGRCHIAAGRN
jgi:hypothetical protein